MTTASLVDIANYNDKMLKCRLYGHRWPDPDKGHWAKIVGPRGRVISYRLTMKCTRCPKIATDTIDPTSGHKDARRYNDPDGYKLTGYDRSEMRLEHVRRVVDRAADIEVFEINDQGVLTAVG